MSESQQTLSGSATMPRGFHYNADGMAPKTPEPMATAEEAHFTTAPRPRLRLKRRHVSQLTAPTQQFLASVEAADVPIPSIEEADAFDSDQEMIVDLPQVRIHDIDGGAISSRFQFPRLSPPRTPAPSGLPPALSRAPCFPNWSLDSTWSSSDLESSPDYELSRPSTAFSTQTSASLFSHISQLSDDDDCLSPEDEHEHYGSFSIPSKSSVTAEPVVQKEHRRKRRYAWTPAMSHHLWSTYTLYLQDPRVTPIRLGKSNIPPHGVCLRVAREAKRSWRGANTTPNSAPKSRDITPTLDVPRPFMQWPHTSAATRSHLRELCKYHAATRSSRQRLFSKSPTPFQMHRPVAGRRNQRGTSTSASSVFGAHDMAVSLAVSTSETMQPQGPLAQLTMSEPELVPYVEPRTASPEPNEAFPELSPMYDPSPMASLPSPNMGDDDRIRLASPFTYGPSSSSSLAAQVTPRVRSSTVGHRKLLKSPVRLTRSQSGTQKRRSTRAGDEHHRKRPSLAAAFGRELSEALGLSRSLTTPTQSMQTASRNSPQSPEVVSSSRTQMPDPFNIPRPAAESLQQPARLGSPFSGSANSQTFPHRLSAPVHFDMGMFRKPFATVHQSNQLEPSTPSRRASLMSCLSHLDQRFRDFRQRSTEPRRSQSP